MCAYIAMEINLVYVHDCGKIALFKTQEWSW